MICRKCGEICTWYTYQEDPKTGAGAWHYKCEHAGCGVMTKQNVVMK